MSLFLYDVIYFRLFLIKRMSPTKAIPTARIIHKEPKDTFCCSVAVELSSFLRTLLSLSCEISVLDFLAKESCFW